MLWGREAALGSEGSEGTAGSKGGGGGCAANKKRGGAAGAAGCGIALSGDAFASQRPILTAPRSSFQRKEPTLRAYFPAVTVILSVSEESLYMPIVSHLPINTSLRE